MRGLLRADWMRMRGRRDLWLLLVLLAVLTCLSYGFGLSSAIASLAHLPLEASIAAPHRVGPFAYPQSVLAALQNGQLFLLAFMAYLASGTVAAEFQYGTLRTSLVARHDRVGFVVARVTLLGAISLLAILLLAAHGATLPAIATLMGAQLPNGEPVSASRMLSVLAASWLVTLVVIALATLATVASRSAAVGLLSPAVAYGLEAGISNVSEALVEPLRSMTGLLPLTSGTRVLEVVTSNVPDVPLTVPEAAAAVAAITWISGLVALAAIILHRSDIDA